MENIFLLKKLLNRLNMWNNEMKKQYLVFQIC
jgi:hypothetical protein